MKIRCDLRKIERCEYQIKEAVLVLARCEYQIKEAVFIKMILRKKVRNIEQSWKMRDIYQMPPLYEGLLVKQRNIDAKSCWCEI